MNKCQDKLSTGDVTDYSMNGYVLNLLCKKGEKGLDVMCANDERMSYAVNFLS